MNIEAYTKLMIEILGPEVRLEEKNGYQYLFSEKHTYRSYKKNSVVILQCALGPKLEGDSQASRMLSELLQFNLKRMQVLDEVLLLDQEEQQLFLQTTLPLDTLTPEQLRFQLEDFTLNTEVIENKFFPKQ